MGHRRSNHLDTTTSTGSASKFDVSGFHTTRPSLPARHHVLLIPGLLPLEKIELGPLIFRLRFFYITVSTRSRLSVARMTNESWREQSRLLACEPDGSLCLARATFPSLIKRSTDKSTLLWGHLNYCLYSQYLLNEPEYSRLRSSSQGPMWLKLTPTT